MKKTMTLAAFAAALIFAASALGQSANFRLGKWLETHRAIISELSVNYVDTLPLDRMNKAGINAMLEQLDPYTEFVPEEDTEAFRLSLNRVYGGIGAIIYKPEKEGNVIINEPYEGSPAVKGGLQSGDELLEIDGVSTHGLEAGQCSERMKGKPGTVVHFKVKKVRSGEIKEIDITRERIHLPDIEYAGMLDDTTGYILQTKFTENVAKNLKEEYLKLKKQGMKRFILDLRGNGGGLMSEAVNIVSLFVPKGSVAVSQKGREDNSAVVYKTLSEPIDTETPIAILVDGGTASSSEIVSGALQDHDRAVIMGRRTYGKGLIQSVKQLPYNDQLKVTIGKYYTPSGRCVQAIDYSHRNEDGSVGHIPDSLTHEFKTLKLGRTVRDGGGIAPDITLSPFTYGRLVYTLVLNGIIEQYALHYVTKHDSIPALDDFHFDEYDDFVEFAKDKKFDYRSSAMALFDQLQSELKKDGMDDVASDAAEALKKAIDIDKETFLRMKKDEVVPFIEEEIAVRYYYQAAGIKVRLRYDKQIPEALKADWNLTVAE
ncbi:MAG: S41 family peptidase [Bacteroidales bacterium]|nr:S41 family peptidase [Bacteroidales bacterium]